MLRLGNRRGPSVRLLRTLQYDRKRRIFHCVALRFIYTRSFKLFISIGYCLHSPLYNVYHVACPYGVGEDTISHTRNRTWSSQTLQHTPTYEAQYLSSKAPHTQVGQYLSSKVPHGSEPYLAVTLHLTYIGPYLVIEVRVLADYHQRFPPMAAAPHPDAYTK